MDSVAQRHTAGPWEVDAGQYGPIHIVAPGYRKVAEISRRYDADDAEANARLIAAAPDLLAACKALIEHDEAARRPEALIGDIAAGYYSVLLQVRAAIEKAEGTND